MNKYLSRWDNLPEDIPLKASPTACRARSEWIQIFTGPNIDSSDRGVNFHMTNTPNTLKSLLNQAKSKNVHFFSALASKTGNFFMDCIGFHKCLIICLFCICTYSLFLVDLLNYMVKGGLLFCPSLTSFTFREQVKSFSE